MTVNVTDDSNAVAAMEEFRHRFEEAKEQLRQADGHVIDHEIALKETLVRCQASVEQGDFRGLTDVACIMRNRLLSDVSPAEDESSKVWENDTNSRQNTYSDLKSWRPPRKIPVMPAAEPSIPAENLERVDTTGDDDTRFSLLERKAHADAAVRAGDYMEALEIYDALLQEEGEQEQGRIVEREAKVAAEKFKTHEDEDCSRQEGVDKKTSRKVLLCNSALCTLKLSAVQPSLACANVMLRRTLQLCDEAISLDASNAKAHFRRGCALEAMERFPEACEAYDKASNFEPGDPRIRESLHRAMSYEIADWGAEATVRAQAQLKAVESTQTWRKTRHPLQVRRRPASNPMASCRECCGDASDDNFFAAPCGHGPFCAACRDEIILRGRGLQVCPECRRFPGSTLSCGLIEEWRVGAGGPIVAPTHREACTAAAQPIIAGERSPRELSLLRQAAGTPQDDTVLPSIAESATGVAKAMLVSPLSMMD